MTPSIRSTLDTLAAETLGLQGPIPEGELSEHLDSMDRLALVVAIEDHFAIAFDDDDDQGIHTIDDVIRVVQTKLGERDA